MFCLLFSGDGRGESLMRDSSPFFPLLLPASRCCSILVNLLVFEDKEWQSTKNTPSSCSFPRCCSTYVGACLQLLLYRVCLRRIGGRNAFLSSGSIEKKKELSVSLLGVHIMDDEEAVVVWSELPDDILDKVLLCLPSHSLSRMRAVCKQWHSLLSSPSFLQRYDCRFCYGEDHVLVFVVSSCEAMMYNPISSKWHLLPLVDSPLSTLYNLIERAVTAAAGGLVCILGKYAAQDSNCTVRQLLVCNLLTKSWRCLPPLPPECPQIGQPIMGMLHDRQNFCYKIITVWPDRGPIVEYDSRNSTWTVIGRCPVSFLSFKSMQSTVCEGLLYFLVEGGPLRGGMFVRAYDIHHHEWHTPSAPLPSRDLQSPCLVEHKGRILMAGLIRGVGIRLWRLKLWTMGWEIVAEMPSQLFADFNLDTPGFPSRVNCMRICDSIYFISNFRRPIVAYEVMKNVWHMLPMSYPPSCSNPDGMEQYFSVQPSLNDAV